MTNDILRAVDTHKEAVLILLDLSAAFDTIDHDILINRLSHRHGLRDSEFAWFTNYLRHRTQKVRIGEIESASISLVFGVLQRSMLGPILFIMYIAPLEDIIKQHDIDAMFYADDTQLYSFA